MIFNSPLSLSKADYLIAIPDLPPESKIVEIGCGNGVLLNEFIKYYDAFGLGIDLDSELIKIATEDAASTINDKFFEYRVADASKEELPTEHFDLAICNGSSHAFGKGEHAYTNTIKHLSTPLKPGGHLLLGELYWRKTPDKDYVEFLGDSSGAYNNFEENIAIAEDYGFDTLYATSSNQDEWDNFEWYQKQKINQLIAQDPDNSELQAKKVKIDRWLKGYLKWGRYTMGYGLYIFTKKHN